MVEIYRLSTAAELDFKLKKKQKRARKAQKKSIEKENGKLLHNNVIGNNLVKPKSLTYHVVLPLADKAFLCLNAHVAVFRYRSPTWRAFRYRSPTWRRSFCYCSGGKAVLCSIPGVTLFGSVPPSVWHLLVSKYIVHLYCRGRIDGLSEKKRSGCDEGLIQQQCL